jgi:hypothetical protein
MAVFKRVLCKERLRQVPPQFSWIDHRLVRDRHISRCSANALALYLFLVTVADGQGLSYYADATICRLLPLDAEALDDARRELIANRLIAYQRPVYQVLALGPSQSSVQQSSVRRPPSSRPQSQPSGPLRQAQDCAGDAQPTGPVPSNVEGPQSLAEIFRKLRQLPDPTPARPLDPQNRKKP